MDTQRFCPVCKSEIVFDYVHPIKSFRIEESGNIVRDDNNLSDTPELQFYCSEDREHNVYQDGQEEEWEAEVEWEFRDKGCYDL